MEETQAMTHGRHPINEFTSSSDDILHAIGIPVVNRPSAFSSAYVMEETQVMTHDRHPINELTSRFLVGIRDGGHALAVHGLAARGSGAGGVQTGHASLPQREGGPPGHLGEHRLLVARVVHVDLPRGLRLGPWGCRVTPPQTLYADRHRGPFS